MKAENLSVGKAIDNNANKKFIAIQIKSAIDNMRGMQKEIENFLNSETNEPLSSEYYQYLSVLPKELRLFIEQSFESISRQNLDKIDVIIEEVGRWGVGLLKDNNSAKILLENLFESIDNNTDRKLFINKLLELNSSNPFAAVAHPISRYNVYFNYIFISSEAIKHGDTNALIHELGHLLHCQTFDGKTPVNFTSIVNNAANQARESGKLKEIVGIYEEINCAINKQAQKEVNMTIKEKVQEFIALQKGYVNSGMTLPQAVIQAKQNIYARRVSENYDRIKNSRNEFGPELADIIDAVYKGANLVDDVDMTSLIRRHGFEYYLKRSPFDEMIADFTTLKVAGKEHDLQLLRDMFGVEFYDMLDTTFHHLVQPTIMHEQQPLEENITTEQQEIPINTYAQISAANTQLMEQESYFLNKQASSLQDNQGKIRN